MYGRVFTSESVYERARVEMNEWLMGERDSEVAVGEASEIQRVDTTQPDSAANNNISLIRISLKGRLWRKRGRHTGLIH